jgi:hypothetical protein
MISSQVLTRISSRATEERDALEELGQVSSLGVLADKVVLAALRIRSGLEQRSEDPAVREAAEMLRRVAAHVDDPFDVTTGATIPSALRLLKAAGTTGASQAVAPEEGEVSEREAREWYQSLADALEAMREGTADPQQLDDIQVRFNFLADVTLETANEVVRRDHVGGRWTQALHS